MIDSGIPGPAWPAQGWIPAPRYLLRRDRVMREIRSWSPARVLEVGCGAGAMLHELSRAGFDCTGLETSAQAIDLAKRIRTEENASIDLRERPSGDWDETFDAILALEVLEHIPDDVAALRTWAAWMKPAGTLLLSVPAHRSRWGPADEWAGHVRRYDRADLASVFDAAGFHIRRFECYGFPLGNVVDLASRGRYRKAVLRAPDGSVDREANNKRSGIDRHDTARLHSVISTRPGRWLMQAACAAQACFVRSNLGTGYFVVAQKR